MIQYIIPRQVLKLLWNTRNFNAVTSETLAELPVLWAYVENQTILEPILLYRASKCKQTQEQGNKNVYGPIFGLFMR